MNFILILIGSGIFINAIYLLFSSNFDIGKLLTLILGTFFIIWGMFEEKIRVLTETGLLKYVKYGVLGILVAELLLVLFVAVYGISDNSTGREKAAIVLGAAVKGTEITRTLRYRLDKAVEYHKENPDAVIIVTGGKGFQEDVTEAFAMEEYLLSKGVAQDKIVKEEKATSTEQNMLFSKKITDEMFEGEYEVLIITTRFHTLRSILLAKKAGFSSVTHIGAPMLWHNLLSNYLRESLTLVKLFIFG